MRLSLVCEGPSQIVQAARWFMELSKNKSETKCCLQVVRIKNKFAFAREELNGGYRDLMLSVLYLDSASNLSIIGEIQV